MLDQSNPLDREFVCMAWIHTLIGHEFQNKKFHVAPPVLARAYQVLSEARVGINQCKKIQDTPFPFAYAQLCFFMLHIFMIIVPWVFSRYIGGHICSALVSAASVWVYFSVNATAAEYEQPFGRKHSKGSGEWSQGRLPLKQYEEELKYRMLAGSLAMDVVDPAKNSDLHNQSTASRQSTALSVGADFNAGLQQKRKSVLQGWNAQTTTTGKFVKAM
jgi:hypothetical protein